MAEHKDGCTCGDNCSCGDNHEADEITVTLTLDNDEELECGVLCIFDVEEKEYIVLLPLDESKNQDNDVFIYRYTEVDGAPELSNIETDDEYEKAADAFDEWLDQQEFDEIQSELDAAE